MSDENNDKKEPQVYELDANSTPEEPAAPEEPQNSEAQEKIQELEKDLLYLRAEFENYRRQAIKERSNLVKYAGENLARDLLGVVDIFDSAFDVEVNDSNWRDFLEGMKLTRTELLNILNKHGIEESSSTKFDPHIHEALSSEPTDKVEPGHIVRFHKKPYTYHDRVLRVGQVIVASEPPKAPEEPSGQGTSDEES